MVFIRLIAGRDRVNRDGNVGRRWMMILSLFDYSGNMINPWADAGHHCMIVDIKHPAGYTVDGNITRVGADIMQFLPPENVEMIFAFPPCTHLASSGARWWSQKGDEALREALALVEWAREIIDITDAPWMIENPVGRLSTYWRKPDYYFDPCDYGGYLTPPGDAYTKRTCLWTGNGFIMPEPRRVDPVDGSKMHRLPPSAKRAELRSETPRGFSRAVYLANGGG